MMDDIMYIFKSNTEEDITTAILRFWPDADGLSEALSIYICDGLLTTKWVNNVAPKLNELKDDFALIDFLKGYKYV